MYRCHLCGNEDLRHLYGGLDRVIGCGFVRCRKCGLMQVEQVQSPGEEVGFYADKYYTLEHKVHEYESRLDVFGKLLRRLKGLTGGRALLDAGCGPGDFVAAARSLGWDAEGVEVSPGAVADGMRRHGAPLHVGSIMQWPGVGKRYDVVTFLNVLDHLPSPVQALTTARGLLKPGGCVVIRVPNGVFHHALRLICCVSPWAVRKFKLADYFSVHLFSFTPATIRHMLRSQGFEQVRTVNAPVSSGDPSGRLDGWNKVLLGGLKHGVFWVCEIARLVTFGRLCLAPSILVTARIEGRPDEVAETRHV